MRDRLLFAAGALVLSAVALSGCRGGLPFGKKPEKKEDTYTVAKADVRVQVIESGTIESSRNVEVKSRVAGRLEKLYVREGDLVQAGDLIAEIDPEETELALRQNQAQLRGAQSSLSRTDVEIEQRRVTVVTQLERARLRISQLEDQMKAQPTLTSSSIKSARSGLEANRQAREQLVQITHPNERTSLEREVQDGRVSLEDARREMNRRQALVDQGFVPKREAESARVQFELAETRLASAEDRLSRLGEQHALEVAQADKRIEQSQAELARAEAARYQDSNLADDLAAAKASERDAVAALRDIDALRASRAQSQASVDQIQTSIDDTMRLLRETQIRAPMGGVVTAELAEEGELVASLSSFSSGTPIVTVEDRSAMVVKLNINEIDAAKLSVGTPAEISVDALPDQTFAGSVTKIAPSSLAAQQSAAGGQAQSADAVVRFEVEVTFDAPSERIKSGMSARCTMTVTDRQDVVSVPTDYLGDDKDGTFVMIAPAGEGEKPERRAVTIGARSGVNVEIVDGVTEGEKLVRPEFTGPKRQGMSFGPPPEEGEGEGDSAEGGGE